jgi:hypothetical protein
MLEKPAHNNESRGPATMNNTTIRRLLTAATVFACATAAHAADPLFETNTLLEIRLEGPFKAIARDDDPDPLPRPGVFVLGDLRLDVELAPRGKSRRLREKCKFPPLWVNFDKAALEGTVLAGQNKLKLVTHCESLTGKETAGADELWLEYLAYRFMNLISDQSFRVRPLRITYVESGDDEENPHPGFFIEHKKRLSDRLGMPVSDLHSISPSTLVPAPSQDVELYQLMIGNTDFSMIRGPQDDDSCCHNLILMEQGGQFLPIPYDFDISGLVDPRHAVPAEGLPIKRVTQRLYRGFCRDPQILEASIAKFLANEAAIMQLVAEQPGLDDRRRKKATDFVGGFFEILKDPKKRKREIEDDCRGD